MDSIKIIFLHTTEHVFGLDKGKIKATGPQISKESYGEISVAHMKLSVKSLE